MKKEIIKIENNLEHFMDDKYDDVLEVNPLIKFKDINETIRILVK